MKKIILLLLFTISISAFSQKQKDSTEVFIKDYSGINIKGYYQLKNEKAGKKEYLIWICYKNETDKEIFYKKGLGDGTGIGIVQLIDHPMYIYPVEGTKTIKKIAKKKIYNFKPKKQYVSVAYSKWLNDGEVPKFKFKIETKVTLETDYSVYE
jgi:hypothetical protein